QRALSEDLLCAFRVSGQQPELWHADTGIVEPACVWRESNGRTTVPIHFDPTGSVFVVFRRPAPREHLVDLVHRAAPGAPAPAKHEPLVPKIVIQKAVYEAVDGAGGADVTAKVAAMVAAGELAIPANNGAFGDP